MNDFNLEDTQMGMVCANIIANYQEKMKIYDEMISEKKALLVY